MRRRLAPLFIAGKKQNIHRRLNLLAALATYANGSSGDAIGGEADDFMLSLLVSSAASRQGAQIEPQHLRPFRLIAS
jgi:hypothetical protein